MTPLRWTAFVAGLLFIITFVTSIPVLVLYLPVLGHANYIVGAGADTRIAFGALLEMILIVASIGTAVVLFPILKRQNEGLALGYVTARLVESAFIAIGIGILLAVVKLRRDVGGAAGADSLVPVGRSLVAIHQWTFVLGPGWVVGIGNGLLLGYLMYRSGLVLRGMAMLGLIGGPLILISGSAVLLNVIDRGSAAGHRDDPGIPLGVVAWHLPHGQGIQAVSHHRRTNVTGRSTPGVAKEPGFSRAPWHKPLLGAVAIDDRRSAQVPSATCRSRFPWPKPPTCSA